MFLRVKERFKDGKEHRYWSIVENRRTHGGRVVQRQVLYLGEINNSQKAAWCKTIEVIQEGQAQPTQMAIFPGDRTAPAMDCDVVQIKLSELQLHHPRQWGGMLVGVFAVGSTPARCVLGREVAPESAGYALVKRL